AFIAARSFVKLRLASVWQQALVVCLALALYAFALFWIGGLTGQATRALVRFVPVGVSVALWPIVFLLLRGLRRRFVASRRPRRCRFPTKPGASSTHASWRS